MPVTDPLLPTSPTRREDDSLDLEAVLEAADELIGFFDLDTLYRRGVELCRERLGVVRAGLFLRSTTVPDLYHGTWGTDLDGHTTDEHQASGIWPSMEIEETRKTLRRLFARRWEAKNPCPVSWHLSDGSMMINGEAWNCVHCLTTGDRIVGVLFVDPGRSGQPLDPQQMDLVATYCALLARIIEHRQVQESLRQADEQRFESLGVLAGGIAHDFNNLLSSVVGRLELVLRTTNFLSGADRSHLELALGSCHRGTSLSNRLLTFARGGSPMRRAVDAVALLKRTVAESIGVHPLAWKLELKSEHLPDIWGDESQLAQVIQNLAVNCCQWVPLGGHLEITISTLCTNDTEMLEILFEDDGPGIPESLGGRIFEPYYTTRPNGSGLGLATCRSILNRHGGSIACGSSKLGGAGFRMLLPVAQATPPPSPPKPPPPVLNCRILVMDDELEIRETTKTLLEFLGAEVSTFKDGQEAAQGWIAADAAGRGFELGILDLTVPGGVSGQTASEQILSHEPSARLVVCSGYSNDLILSNPSASGFIASLSKPFRREELARVVAKALGRQEIPDPFGDG